MSTTGPTPPHPRPVIQLALLLVLGLFGSLLAFAFGRLEVKRSPVSATVKRAEGALERASLSLLRVGALRGLALLVVPAVGLAAFAGLGTATSSVSGGGRAAFSVLALLIGGASTLLHARFALGLGARAASSAAAARARGSARTLRPLLRGSVAIALFGEGLGLLGLAGAFASLYAVRGGFAAPGSSAQLASDIAKLLPAFALGAGVTALSLAREGSVASAAARVGSARQTEVDSGLATSDARDPALLAQLVGHLVGELLPSALCTYVCGLVATTSVAVLIASASTSSTGALASLLLVVLVRTFGGVASVCGVLAARVTDDEPPARALWRGQLSALVVALFGMGAALFWLMREHWGALFVAGAAGLCSTTLVALGAGLPLRRSAPPTEARPGSEASSILRGLASGFSSAWPSLLVPALALASVESGLRSHASPWLLLVSFVAGALALGPFALSLHGFGVLSQHTRGVVALARMEQESGPRLTKLDEASALGRASGGTYASLALGAALLLGLATLASPAAPSPGLGVATLAIALGVALLTLFGASAARAAISGARLVAAEVERQRREAPRAAEPQPDFTPSYKSCVEAMLEAARSVSVVGLAAMLASPFALGAVLRSTGVSTADAPFASFGVAAVAAGLVFTLGGRATRALLGEPRSRARSGDLAPPTTQAESFGDLVGVPIANSVEALALVLALTVLCLAPLSR